MASLALRHLFGLRRLGLPIVLAALCLAAARPSAVRAQANPGVAPAYTVLHKVPYLAPSRTETLEITLPRGRAPGVRSPGIVIIHGGGWSSGTSDGGREREIGRTLAGAGYVCASVEYRLAVHDRWPINLFDCKNAVRFLRANAAKYGIDPDHIGVIGGSAGGHLALMVGFTEDVAALEPPAPYPGVSDRVQAVVDMYGIADIRTRQKIASDGAPTGVHENSDTVLGDLHPITDADRALASPDAHLSARIPPVLILHGLADTTVDRDQSINLDKQLTALGVPHQLILIPGVGHTFDLYRWNGKRLPMDLRPVVIGFFDKYLRGGQSAAGEKP